LRPLLASELDIARFSGWQGGPLERFAALPASPQTAVAEPVKVAVLTEGAIRTALLERLEGTSAGDAIDIAQFYLSERSVARSLLAAAARGVRVRVLLDPNRDAFGFEKSGIPNRPLGNHLLRESDGAIRLRWYRTHGEQFHAKFAGVRSGGRAWFTVGSANLTRRNIGDLNLEANLMVDAPLDSAVTRQAWDWFEALWNNAGGMRYTDDASAWQEDSALRYWKYRVMEASGLSTF
jgi:phosphatidylserine/phosphatidylglycerophosphate/cardiolipin synthase-like enzyme